MQGEGCKERNSSKVYGFFILYGKFTKVVFKSKFLCQVLIHKQPKGRNCDKRKLLNLSEGTKEFLFYCVQVELITINYTYLP